MKNTRYVIRKGTRRLQEAREGCDTRAYEEFKKMVVEKIREFLPEKYREYEISIEQVPKNNCMRDSLRIANPMIPEASPNVYVDELYSMYRDGTPLEDVLQSGAAIFSYGMDYARSMSDLSVRACEREDNIIAQVINTERNLEMLQSVPHTDYLDLSVIYRHYIALPDGTFNLATVDDSELEKIDLSVEGIHKLALENTKRLMPIKREHLGEGVYLLTNKKHLLGANVLLFKSQLRWIARRCKADLFLAASSIHEVMVLPVNEARLSFLRETVRDANRNLVEPGDVLSDTVYRFDRERDLLLPAWEEPGEQKIWDEEASAEGQVSNPVLQMS